MRAHSLLFWSLCLLLGLGFGCASARTSTTETRIDFFGPAGASGDVWYAKVEEWQQRARRDRAADLSAQGGTLRGSGVLLEKMASFTTRRRRELAAGINLWSRLEARRFYINDHTEAPEFDHWPTVSELLANDGDDCDGLDLIPYQLLLEFGFPSDQVYRLIVRREPDGANHMVTLWFDNPENPWVLDATGAMANRLRRFSEVPREGWTPMKMFNETRQFEVVERPAPRSIARD